MKPILVTGGTGFVGANVVRELVALGAGVRVLARPGGDRRALDGLPVEIVEGDLLDRASLERAVTGADTLYHVAADYRLWARDPAELHRVNVGGTRAILEAAGEGGVRRVVYTSTVGALGIPKDGTPGTEDTPVSLADMVGPYKASKFLAERIATDFARRGLPVVIVNPSAPIGPWDVKPTPTGQMIVDFMRGRMFATLTPASTSCTCATSPAATSWPPSAGASASATSSATCAATSRWPRSAACSRRRPDGPHRGCGCRTPSRGAALPAPRPWRG